MTISKLIMMKYMIHYFSILKKLLCDKNIIKENIIDEVIGNCRDRNQF